MPRWVPENHRAHKGPCNTQHVVSSWHVHVALHLLSFLGFFCLSRLLVVLCVPLNRELLVKKGTHEEPKQMVEPSYSVRLRLKKKKARGSKKRKKKKCTPTRVISFYTVAFVCFPLSDFSSPSLLSSGGESPGRSGTRRALHQSRRGGRCPGRAGCPGWACTSS